MLCENCNQHEANVKYTQIINGEKKQMLLCENCAKEMGIDNFSFDMPINLSNFFGDLLGEYEENQFTPKLLGTNELKCQNCGMTYDEFQNAGKMGCSHCYDAFSNKIDPLLKRLHGSTKYIGRKSNSKPEEMNAPKEQNSKLEEIQKLKTKIKTLIKEEKYEEAAKVRDKIKKLEEE